MRLWSASCVAQRDMGLCSSSEGSEKTTQTGESRLHAAQVKTASGTLPKETYWSSQETSRGYSNGGALQGSGDARGVASCTHLD